jgi:transcriptional regulator with XRE-family HTH domain
MNTSKKFGKFMKEKRGNLGYNMEELARVSEVSAPTIMRIEKGMTKSPSPDTLRKLARSLDIPYQEVIKNAGILDPDSPKRKETPTHNAVIDFTDEGSLTPDEREQLERFKQFLISQRKND